LHRSKRAPAQVERSGLSISLDRTPNDAHALSASIRLPVDGKATLELFDLAGRRVARQPITGSGAGEQRIHMSVPPAQARGVYWLVLRQGAQRAAVRVAILR
jgi:hypothetical protein